MNKKLIETGINPNSFASNMSETSNREQHFPSDRVGGLSRNVREGWYMGKEPTLRFCGKVLERPKRFRVHDSRGLRDFHRASRPRTESRQPPTEAIMRERVESKLSRYNCIAVVSASHSMRTEDMPRGTSRWTYIREFVSARVCDLGKLDVVTFGGSEITPHQDVTVAKLDEVFSTCSPHGGAPLTEALQAAFTLAGKSSKPDYMIVIIDSAPDDKTGVERAIMEQSREQERDVRLAVHFTQVGADPAATEYLRELEDGLRDEKFEIVASGPGDLCFQLSGVRCPTYH